MAFLFLHRTYVHPSLYFLYLRHFFSSHFYDPSQDLPEGLVRPLSHKGEAVPYRNFGCKTASRLRVALCSDIKKGRVPRVSIEITGYPSFAHAVIIDSYRWEYCGKLLGREGVDQTYSDKTKV